MILGRNKIRRQHLNKLGALWYFLHFSGPCLYKWIDNYYQIKEILKVIKLFYRKIINFKHWAKTSNIFGLFYTKIINSLPQFKILICSVFGESSEECINHYKCHIVLCRGVQAFIYHPAMLVQMTKWKMNIIKV